MNVVELPLFMPNRPPIGKDLMELDIVVRAQGRVLAKVVEIILLGRGQGRNSCMHLMMKALDIVTHGKC